MFAHFQSLEIERVYRKITDMKLRSVAITACNESEGVSSLCVSLAQRHLLAGYSTLLVDFNIFRPTLKPIFTPYVIPKVEQHFPVTQLVSPKNKELALSGVASPYSRDTVLKLRSSESIETALSEWHKDFDLIIFDTSPLNKINVNNIPAERVAQACEGTFFLMLSGCTTVAQVGEGMARLKNANAKVVGCVLNDQHYPSLKTELLRETERVKKFLPRLTQFFQRGINKNSILNLNI